MSEKKTQENTEEFVPKRRVSDLIASLDDMDKQPMVLASSIAEEEVKKKEEEKSSEDPKPAKKKKKSKYDVFSDPNEDDDETSWLAAISRVPKLKPKKKGISDIYNFDSKKDRKKKKNKDGKTELTNYNKEFEKEMGVLQHLLVQQNEFVEKLQSQYDYQTGNKSPVRGIGKYQTDLISNINSARALSKDIIRELVNTKKTISDLSMKEKKELGLLNEGGENMNEYASGFLKQLLTLDRKTMNGNGGSDIEDMDLSSMSTDDLTEMLQDRDDYEFRSDESMKYLKYEGDNVQVKCLVHADGSHEFAAFDRDDNLIDDYPLPSNDTEVSINRSTMKARDDFGVNYDVILLDD